MADTSASSNEKSAGRLLRNLLSYVLGIGVLLGLIVLYNFVDPAASVPTLEQRYWGGYYETVETGKVWCLVKFYAADGKSMKADDKGMVVLLSADGTGHVMHVSRQTSNASFVQLAFSASENGGPTIEAKQLYLGKRYLWGRLFAGRFGDFWKRNDDDAIRGGFLSGVEGTFALERLPDTEVADFGNRFVFGEKMDSTAIGRLMESTRQTAEAVVP